jgi:archaemetzincin
MRIEIISIGSIDTNILEQLLQLLSERFNATVRVGSNIAIGLFHEDVLRKQYLSTAMLRALCDIPHFDKLLLGVTDVDLYVPSLNFVFGEADPADRVAVISLVRLRPTFYGLQEDTGLFMERAGKEAVHEVGHILHLQHCTQRRCVMFFSNSLVDTDLKENQFCRKCNKYLAANL